MSADLNKDIEASAAIVRKALNGLSPKIAVVLGSGLGGLADQVENDVHVSYGDLPGFPCPGVHGHAGVLVAGTVKDVPVVFLKGRVHLYEGVGPAPLKVMIRTLKALGVDTLFLSNAAGSLRPEAPAGHLIAIADHINISGINPLTGPNDDEWGPRFIPMGDAWDKDLRALLMQSAKALGEKLIEGTYAWFQGPTFETHAEIRMAKILGADSVGMSTVPDCIIARHCGMKVVGCSAITNMGAGLSDEEISHDQTIAQAAIAGEKLSRIVIQFLQDWHKGESGC